MHTKKKEKKKKVDCIITTDEQTTHFTDIFYKNYLQGVDATDWESI